MVGNALGLLELAEMQLAQSELEPEHDAALQPVTGLLVVALALVLVTAPTLLLELEPAVRQLAQSELEPEHDAALQPVIGLALSVQAAIAADNSERATAAAVITPMDVVIVLSECTIGFYIHSE